jgi:hypothetical protein
MPIALMPQRPPFVTFEQRAIEDRNATIKAGGLVMRDVDYVIVRQVGCKDTVEKEAEAWLADIDKAAMSNTYPGEWARHFREKYLAFKAGQAEPELGLSVRQWPSLSKAQAENCIAAGVRTVEDIAAMNEPTMQRVGMGARELKQKAKAYLESRDANKAAEQITALQAQLNDRDTRIETLETRLAALEAGSKKRA